MDPSQNAGFAKCSAVSGPYFLIHLWTAGKRGGNGNFRVSNLTLSVTPIGNGVLKDWQANMLRPVDLRSRLMRARSIARLPGMRRHNRPACAGEESLRLTSPAGFEPATFGFGGRRAIQLCHGDRDLSEPSIIQTHPLACQIAPRQPSIRGGKACAYRYAGA